MAGFVRAVQTLTRWEPPASDSTLSRDWPRLLHSTTRALSVLQLWSCRVLCEMAAGDNRLGPDSPLGHVAAAVGGLLQEIAPPGTQFPRAPLCLELAPFATLAIHTLLRVIGVSMASGALPDTPEGGGVGAAQLSVVLFFASTAIATETRPGGFLERMFQGAPVDLARLLASYKPAMERAAVLRVHAQTASLGAAGGAGAAAGPAGS